LLDPPATPHRLSTAPGACARARRRQGLTQSNSSLPAYSSPTRC
jgi:hypothetical protein